MAPHYPEDYGFQKTREHGGWFEYEHRDQPVRLVAAEYADTDTEEWLVKAVDDHAGEELDSGVVHGRSGAERAVTELARRVSRRMGDVASSKPGIGMPGDLDMF